MSTIVGILIVGVLVAVILLIRYVVSRAVDKGVDVIKNAVVEKKNKTKQSEQVDLADRYRK